MDMCKDESRQVRITSEKNKNNVVSSNGKARPSEITSRYKSGITSTAPRSLSPNAPRVSTTARTATPKRTQSVERKRPSTPLSPPQRPSTPSTPLSKPAPSLRPSTPSTPLSKPPPSLRPSTPSTPLSKPAPSLRPSTPSTPLSKPAPSLRPSTPPSSTRSITPVRDSMVERLNSSRRSVASRAPDCLWPSIRSLSSSFQNESSSVLARKRDKPSVRNPSPDRTLKSSSNVISERKKTPLRGRNASDQSENSKPVENSHARVTDKLRWSGMMGGKVSSNFSIVKSVDLTDKINRSGSLPNSVRGLSPTRKKSSTDVVSKSLQSSSNEAARPVSSGGREKTVHQKSLARNASPFPSQRAPSIIKQTRNPSPVPTLIRPSSPSVIRPSSPSFIRPSSPNKILQTSSTRGMLSPSRTRPSTPNSSSSSTSTRFGVSSSLFSYITDVRKGKRSPNHLEDAHQLRLMCNRDLQWRLVNATADAAFSSQKLIVVDTLYNVWNVTSELWDSVILKRIDVENLKQEMKLELIVKEQIAYLEDWSALETDHSSSLSGTIEALKASTVRLPVTGGARADARAVKNAINSAVDAMQAMGSSICYLLSRVQATNCLISELSEVAATESIMLDECRELLASTAAMQVQECSLRTHLIQQ